MTSTATSPSPVSAPEQQRWTPRLWGILAVVCLALFLDGLDVSMVGVALPSIGAELGLSTTSLQWIVSGYVLGFGGLLLLGGRTADLLGRRVVFLVALAVFAVASLLGGMVDDGALLIATRLIKGVAAAFTAPTGLSIITTTFAEGRARNRALAIYTVFGASGFSSGLIFGGLLTGFGWRWTFLFPVPIALAALVAGILLIPRDRPASSGGYDIGGAVTLTGGMVLLVYTVVSAPETGFTHPTTIASLVLALVLLAVFVVVEQRVRQPLVRLSILRIGHIVRASLAIVALFGSYLSFQFMMTIYLQDVLGWSPLRMALALLPTGILVVLTAPHAGRMIDRLGTPRLIIIALGALSVGYVWFLLRAEPELGYVGVILPTVLLLGAGFALGFPAINVQATSGVSDDEQGLAAGLVQTSMQVGAALVLAVTTALVTAGSHHAGAHADASAAEVLDQFRPGLVLVTVVALAGLAVMVIPLVRGGSGKISATEDDDVRAEPRMARTGRPHG
nr:MFS transporter [Phytoactinopolyspora limicola]